MEFADTITTFEGLREVLPQPHPLVADKEVTHLDEHCRSFIERSPFVLIASTDGSGRIDVSPKGDPAGFVRVLDDRTVAIPDRPGNKRADTFVNVLQHPHVGLIFLIPGTKTTLRVRGRARIVRDGSLLESMAIGERVPQLALVIDVAEALFHCSKCIIRSKLWNSDLAVADDETLLARAMKDQTDPPREGAWHFVLRTVTLGARHRTQRGEVHTAGGGSAFLADEGNPA